MTGCKTLTLAVVAAVAMLWGAAGAASADTVFVYDWSTATLGGSLHNNDNWVSLGSAETDQQLVRDADDGDVGHPAGFSGYYVDFRWRPTHQSQYTRANDTNFSYSIPSDALTLSLSFMLSARTGRPENDINRMGFIGDLHIGMQQTGGGMEWSVRTPGTTHLFGTGQAGGPVRIDATHRGYLATAVFDLVNNTLDYSVENLVTGGIEQLASGHPFVGFDPSVFTGLYARNINFDAGKFTISYTIKKPAGTMIVIQ